MTQDVVLQAGTQLFGSLNTDACSAALVWWNVASFAAFASGAAPSRDRGGG